MVCREGAEKMARKKKLPVLLVVLMLLLADFLYWTVPFSLDRAIPEDNWTRVQLWYYDEHSDMREILVEDEQIGQIVSAAQGTTVTNRLRFRTLSQPYFLLYLYSEDGYPTSITIVENGDVSMAVQLDTDHRIYYDGGEELFAILKGMMNRSPAAFSVE